MREREEKNIKKQIVKIGIIIFILGIILLALGSYGDYSIPYTDNSVNQVVFILDTQEKVNTCNIFVICIIIGILSFIMGDSSYNYWFVH